MSLQLLAKQATGSKRLPILRDRRLPPMLTALGDHAQDTEVSQGCMGHSIYIYKCENMYGLLDNRVLGFGVPGKGPWPPFRSGSCLPPSAAWRASVPLAPGAPYRARRPRPRTSWFERLAVG